MATDETEGKVSELVRTLPRSEAPKDFEIKVTARIAQRRAEGGENGFRFPRFAFVAAAIVLVAGAIFFISTSRKDDAEVAREIERSVPPVESLAPTTPSVETSANKADVVRGGNANEFLNSEGVVTDSAARGAQVIEVAPNSQQPVAGQKGASIAVDEMLGSFGAEVSFEGGSWTVKKVMPGGRAAAMGLNAGDAVLAVDGTRLARETRLSLPFEGRVFLIKRPGKEDLLPLAVR